MEGSFRLEDFRLQKVPASLYYVPDFITVEEEEVLLRSVYAAPKPKWTQLSNRRLQNWGGLPHPKGMLSEALPQWLAQTCEKIADAGAFEGATLRPNHVLVNEYLPGQGIMPHTDGPLYFPTVTTISLGDSLVLDFYRPLDSDETAQSKSHECLQSDVCCTPAADEQALSEIARHCGGDGSSSFAERRFASVLINPRSLVVVKHDMYVKYLHGIQDVSSHVIDDKFVNLDSCPGIDIGTTIERTKPRISLTVRVVPKVLKNKILLGKK